MPDAFYEPDGELLVATELTRGPWDAGAQHAGPPAALLGRALEQLPDSEGFQVGRITFEILRSVPIAPVVVSAEILRPGRRVQMVAAELSIDGEVLMRARGWRLRTSELEIPPDVVSTPLPPPFPEERPGSSSSRPGTSSAITRRWSCASNRVASWSWGRRPPGCGCATRWSAASSPRLCSGR